MNEQRILLMGLAAGLFVGLLVLVPVRGLVHAVHDRSAAWQHVDLPRVVLDRTSHDFGRVVSGKVVQARFALFNAGTRRLIVNEDVCGACSARADSQPVIILPNEQAEITVVFDTRHRSGAVEQNFHYTTNDPRQPRFTLQVVGQVGR